MAEKKKSRVSKVSRVLTQARESLKLLETLEKETIAKARTFVRNPIKLNRKQLTNDKIASSLKSLGVASRTEVEQLARKVETLENELATIHAALAAQSGGAKRASKSAPRPAPSAEAFPNT
jgi:polyhydroxyalkanoate synthesis regulator phasin